MDSHDDRGVNDSDRSKSQAETWLVIRVAL
jgi:hypothetical protein